MPEEIGYILEHSGARLLVVDPTLEHLVPEGAAGGDPPLRRLLRGAPGRGAGRRARAAAPDGGRHDLDQLHERHNRPAEGRHVHPPRRVPERARGDAPRAARLALGLSLDAAHVPLQRLVLHLGRDRRCRDARLPAQARAAGRLAALRRGRRHPHVRRADRAGHARRRRRRTSARAADHGHDRGRTPAARRDRPHRGARLLDQSRLRADRDLRPDHDLRVEPGMGRPGRRRPRAAEGTPGTADGHRRRGAGRRRARCATCPPTARRWARW